MKPKTKLSLLDLHGFKVDDVADAVDRFIMRETSRGSARARIMTGNGTGQVKQATVAYLKKGGYPFEFERQENGSRNEGVLIVILE
jgi:DNA-nicking Smr family endonuclease